MPPRDVLSRLADQQDYVLTRRQLAECGITRSSIRQHRRARRWQVLGTRVVVLHNGPLTTRQRWWVGVSHAGMKAMLAGRTAAAAHGVGGMDDGLVHVIAPKSSQVPRLPGVVVHERRGGGPTPVGQPPRQPLADALVSAAGWSAAPSVASGILAAAVQQRRVAPAQLHRALDGRAIRHRALLRAVVDDLAGGAQSFAEIDAVRLARRAGIPSPRRQAVRVVGGRRRFLDVEFDGWAMEIDGALHLRAESQAADHLRHNDLTLGGDRILRFSAITVRLHPEDVVQRLRTAQRVWGSAT